MKGRKKKDERAGGGGGAKGEGGGLGRGQENLLNPGIPFLHEAARVDWSTLGRAFILSALQCGLRPLLPKADNGQIEDLLVVKIHRVRIIREESLKEWS